MFAWIPICSYQSRTYVEVIEAVQRDALDSMGTLFAHTGEGSERQLSSKLSSDGSD